MNLELSDKRVFISGSTKGIGFATAERMAKEGAEVIVNGRTQESVRDALDSLNESLDSPSVEGIAADLSRMDGVETVTEAYPGVDVLVNNVGIYEIKPFEEIPDEDWEELFQTNVMSGVRLARHYFPKMIEENSGRVIFVASESALRIPEEMIHYGMTKSAQLSVARGLAERTKGTDVTVNTVLPGPTDSDGLEPFLEEFAEENELDESDDIREEFVKQARPTSLLQRLINPEEVANTIAYLASPKSSATNGAPVRAEGGLINSMA